MKIVKKIIAVTAITGIVLIVSLTALIIRTQLVRSRLVAERESVLEKLNESLKELGDDNRIEVSSEDYISVNLRSPNINDKELENILKTLRSIPYVASNISCDPRIYFLIEGTSVTLDGIKLIADDETIPLLGIHTGPEINFSKDSLETFYKFLEKERICRISICGDFEQSDIDSMRERYDLIASKNNEKPLRKRTWRYPEIEVTIGNKKETIGP